MAAYVIKFGWPGTTSQRFIRDLTLPVILAARFLAFIPFGLYRSVWRYAGAATRSPPPPRSSSPSSSRSRSWC